MSSHEIEPKLESRLRRFKVLGRYKSMDEITPLPFFIAYDLTGRYPGFKIGPCRDQEELSHLIDLTRVYFGEKKQEYISAGFIGADDYFKIRKDMTLPVLAQDLVKRQLEYIVFDPEVKTISYITGPIR